MGSLGKLYLCGKKIQDGIMQAIINLHSSISVSNCCNDKGKSKELLEGDTCRYEGGTTQGSHSWFLWVGICIARNTFVRLHGETF